MHISIFPLYIASWCIVAKKTTKTILSKIKMYLDVFTGLFGNGDFSNIHNYYISLKVTEGFSREIISKGRKLEGQQGNPFVILLTLLICPVLWQLCVKGLPSKTCHLSTTV